MPQLIQIADRANVIKKVEEYTISDISKYFKRVERLTSYSPNILAVVNFPDNPNGVITRGYIFNICLEEAYGSLEKAVEHFVKRSAKLQGFVVYGERKEETREPLLHLLGFVKGKDWSKSNPKNTKIDRDIVYFPFEKSDEEGRATANPFLVKSTKKEEIGIGGISTINPNEMEDLYPLLAEERMRRLTLSPQEFRNNFPDLTSLGIRYV
ncbi:MAG: hypothetical protein AABW51_02420 [Nanoarchaeota archaeon]